MLKPVIFLMGPTATGKTDVAVNLRENFAIDIISVDSALVYRGMNIGTAKPDQKTLKRAPHKLIDICEPTENYSAARFRSDALEVIEAIEAEGKVPLLVGGTGLYFRALESGLSELPSADSHIRQRLKQRYRDEGLFSLYKELKAADPVAAERINQNDSQRITRALEVFYLTGRPMSELQQQQQNQALERRIIKLALVPVDREKHRERVKVRFMHMLNRGLLEEVKRFYEREDIHAALPAMRMVGYRQVWKFLDGSIDYEEMVNHAIVATRGLAKRQLTWLRKENGLKLFDSEDKNKLNQIKDYIGLNM